MSRTLIDDHPDDGGSKNLWNVSKLLPDYTAEHLRRQSSYSPLWESEISPIRSVCLLYSDADIWKEVLISISISHNYLFRLH
jgi:hypothetical protein